MPTEILRPNGAGDETQLNRFPSFGPANWDCVNDTTADDATEYVFASVTSVRVDSYALEDTALTTETIDSIDVTDRDHRTTPSGTVSRGVRLSSSNTMSATDALDATWTTRTTTALARPGGGSWAVADLNGLQGRISLQRTGSTGEVRCTQFYVTVNYTAGGGSILPHVHHYRMMQGAN